MVRLRCPLWCRRAVPRWLRGAVRSRRSRVLLVFGALFVLIGFSYLGVESQITASPQAALPFRGHLALFPLDVWACMFIAVGAAAIAGGLARYQTLGYTALMTMSTWWGIEYVVSWLMTGYDRAVLGALTWTGLSSVLAVIVGWPDPPQVPADVLDQQLLAYAEDLAPKDPE